MVTQKKEETKKEEGQSTSIMKEFAIMELLRMIERVYSTFAVQEIEKGYRVADRTFYGMSGWKNAHNYSKKMKGLLL